MKAKSRPPITINGVLCTWNADQGFWVVTKDINCNYCRQLPWAYEGQLISSFLLPKLINRDRPILLELSEGEYTAHCGNPYCKKRLELDLLCPKL